MKVSELMQAMADAGAPMQAILIAVQAIEAKDAEIEQRRAGDRERKRRQRNKDTDVTVTGQSRDTDVTVTDAPSLSLPPNENNSNPPTHTHPDNTSRARKAGVFPRPDWADPQVWSDWMEVRKAKGGRNTATAYAGFLASIEREATDEWPPGRLLAHAVSESWKSIHRPKEYRNDRPKQSSSNDEIRNPYVRAALRKSSGSGIPF